MGFFMVLKLLKSLLLLSTIGSSFVTAFLEASSDGNVVKDDNNNITTSANPPPPPPPPPPQPSPPQSNVAPFKPSIAVVVAALTTIFSVTFLLLLYVKHCKRENGYSASSRGRAPPSTARKNSGVDRTVIEALPIFRFGSLWGEKDGLECAVCLNRFESTEVLRLLPKCKHAFHVECVDTWLDAHSTCPLCRYRVDPEDILLLGDIAKILAQNEPLPPPQPPPAPAQCEENERSESLRRVSGRHSSAGEGGLQIVLHRPDDSSESHLVSGGGDNNNHPLTTRRSLDSWNMRKKKKPEVVSVGCFDRQYRKDGLLLTSQEDRTSSERRRLEHRIIIGGGGRSEFHRRWSDVQASDLLYLRSEMIMSDSCRSSASSSGSRPSASRRQQQQQMQHQNQQNQLVHNNNDDGQSGRSVINGRSVSEITGLSRFGNTGTETSNNYHRLHRQQQWRWRRREEREEQRQEEAGLVSRWLAWISQSPSQTELTQPDVRS